MNPKTLIAAALLALSAWLPAGAAQAVEPTRTTDGVAEQIHCIALNIYFEARGESEAGMIAVGHVVLNRMKDPRFPDTACEVIRQGGERVRHRCQFSWFCDGKSDEPRDAEAWRQASALARAVFWDFVVDPTRGATFYHADYVSPHWRTAFDRGPKIGQHIFYSRPDPRAEQLADARDG